MAHAWIKTEGEGWVVVPPHLSDNGPPAKGEVLLVRAAAGAKERWLLLAPSSRPTVSVNGLPLVLGIRVLKDRDEVHLAGAPPLFFSTERIAQVEPYASGGKRGRCPRCDTEIADGVPSVRCPQCGLAYHQDSAGGMECWTYGPTCARCPQKTGLEAGYAWTPEGL
jgi:hypothetical protein